MSGLPLASPKPIIIITGTGKKTSEKKFDQIKYQNEYNRKNYDHINIMVAKGKKDIVKAKAKEKGESMSEYIWKAVEKRLLEDE